MNSKKILVLVVMAALIGLFFYFDGGQYLTLESLKANQAKFQEYYQEHTAFTLAAFFIIYVAVTALSIPGAAIMTLAAGALFGFITGTIVVSFASTIGATCAFLVSRFLLRDFVQTKFGDKLRTINEGVEREGGFYLFSLRLMPIFPFFLVNMLMGLTPINVRKFFFISQIGMLPGTMVYVNAGTQLSQIESLKGILSPQLFLSFILLGIFPVIAKKILEFVKKKQGK